MTAIIASVGPRGRPIDQHHFRRWSALLTSSGEAEVEVGDGVAFACAGSCCLRPAIGEARGIRIVADARIDDSEGLTRAVNAPEEWRRYFPTNSELIVAAYLKWGVGCLDHLIGDFAFALWDESEQMLFAARDQLGVRPLYYSHGDHGMLISSRADVLFRHPDVDRSLDRQTIVDFLTLEEFEPDATAFEGMRRLPAAHRLIWRGAQLQVSRYWSLQPQVPLQLKDDRDYPALLAGLMETAVRERVRGAPVCIGLSGGLDSTAVVVAAKEIGADVLALTATVSRLMPELELPFARETARHLGVPLTEYSAVDGIPYQGSMAYQARLPLPQNTPFDLSELHGWAVSAAHGPLYATGYGPDASLIPEPILREVFRSAAGAIRVGTAAVRHVARYRRRPPLGIRRRGAAARGGSPEAVAPPPWLDPAVWNVFGRERRLWAVDTQLGGERPLAVGTATTLFWSHNFERYAANGGGFGVTTIHPAFDLRVLQFCLSLPSVPWCWDKHIMRLALRGKAPDSVTLRRKTALIAHPLTAHVQTHGVGWFGGKVSDLVREFCVTGSLEELPPLVHTEPHVHARPLVLSRFLEGWMKQPRVG